jgi:hypothetical protein
MSSQHLDNFFRKRMTRKEFLRLTGKGLISALMLLLIPVRIDLKHTPKQFKMRIKPLHAGDLYIKNNLAG